MVTSFSMLPWDAYERAALKDWERLLTHPATRERDVQAFLETHPGALTLDTGKITLGPLPVALGQPGIIPPRTPTGCI